MYLSASLKSSLDHLPTPPQPLPWPSNELPVPVSRCYCFCCLLLLLLSLQVLVAFLWHLIVPLLFSCLYYILLVSVACSFMLLSGPEDSCLSAACLRASAAAVRSRAYIRIGTYIHRYPPHTLHYCRWVGLRFPGTICVLGIKTTSIGTPPPRYIDAARGYCCS